MSITQREPTAESNKLAKIPLNLEIWVCERELLCLALDATHLARWTGEKLQITPSRVTRHSQAALATMLIYSYAVGRFASQEIEAACTTDLSLAYLSNGNPTEWGTLRSFRRHHKDSLIGALASLMFEAWKHQRTTRSPGLVATPDFQAEASGRVHESARLDSMALDD